MIDNIRLYISDEYTRKSFEKIILEDLSFEDPKLTLDARSGAIEYPLVSKLKNLSIKVYKESAFVCGSLHKFHNLLVFDQDQNANDFYFDDLKQLIKNLIFKYPNFGRLNLTQLEFGLNIELDISASEIIENNVLIHNFTNSGNIKTFKGEGLLKEYVYTDFTIKIYDKAKQYGIKDKHILRFEIKFKKRAAFKVLKIKQLLDPIVLFGLFELLLNRFDQIMIIDCIDVSKLPKRDQKLYYQYTNIGFWNKLKGRANKDKKYRERKKAEAFFKKHDLLNLKKELRKKLLSKFLQITKCETFSSRYKLGNCSESKNKAA